MITLTIVIVWLVVVLLGCTMTSFQQEQGVASKAEQAKIEAWIKEKDLNQYADPRETVYMGATPLFNERNGEIIGKYEYILRKYPNRPWLK